MIKRTHVLALAAALATGVALAAVPVVRHLSAPAPAAATATAQPPRIEVLEVVPARQLSPGAQLSFKLLGSAGGQAVVKLAEADNSQVLKEVSPGVYLGVYLVGTGDNLRAHSPVTAELTLGGLTDSATLDGPLLQAAGGAARPARAGARTPAATTTATPATAAAGCADGVNVQLAAPAAVKGESTGQGDVTGGVLGAVNGSQVGGGSREAAGA